MHKSFLKTGFVLCALAVALGAFGAHGLKKIVPPEALIIFETGVRYHFYHSIALLVAALLYKEIPHPKIVWAGRFFMGGILLFSGSLYLMVMLWPNAGKLGMITPLGGTGFIIGWLLLAMAVSSISRRES